MPDLDKQAYVFALARQHKQSKAGCLPYHPDETKCNNTNYRQPHLRAGVKGSTDYEQSALLHTFERAQQ